MTAASVPCQIRLTDAWFELLDGGKSRLIVATDDGQMPPAWHKPSYRKVMY